MALTEMGELYRCKGDLGLAEHVFGEAYEKGWMPQPGLALVLFAKNDLVGATQMIRRSVEHAKDEPAALVHLLPAQVEIALAAGDDAVADAAAQRLAQVAFILGTSAAAAGANASVAGMLAQHHGDLSTAVRQLELSVQSWQEARSPYEASQARMRLATAFEELGDIGSAKLELATARKTFERLGAAPEARQAARRLGDDTPVHAVSTFMFTDIVDSTSLLTSIGDNAWHGVRQWHDRTVTTIVGEHRGRIVKHTGDGFFATFDDPAVAVECAVAIQRTLEAHRHSDGFAPSVRIGLHVGSAISADDDYAGRDVVVAARIGALASGDEILVSAALADHLGTHLRVSPPAPKSLKGIPETVGVAAVAWR
jgi:class 3 adenylate cyclase